MLNPYLYSVFEDHNQPLLFPVPVAEPSPSSLVDRYRALLLEREALKKKIVDLDDELERLEECPACVGEGYIDCDREVDSGHIVAVLETCDECEGSGINSEVAGICS